MAGFYLWHEVQQLRLGVSQAFGQNQLSDLLRQVCFIYSASGRQRPRIVSKNTRTFQAFRSPPPQNFRINAFASCETPASLRSSGPGATSTNQDRDGRGWTNYTAAVRTGGGGGGRERMQMKGRHFDRNGMLPILINSEIFVVGFNSQLVAAFPKKKG